MYNGYVHHKINELQNYIELSGSLGVGGVGRGGDSAFHML